MFRRVTPNNNMFGDEWVFNKPDGCLWGSTYTPDDDCPSNWVYWCVGERFHVDKCTFGISFELKANTRICEIRNTEDYKKMMKIYGKSRFSASDNAPKWGNVMAIDWAKLAKDYDTFHITEDAFYELRLPMDDRLEVENGYLANFYSYDCESWIMFNLDCINYESIQNHTFSFDEY